MGQSQESLYASDRDQQALREVRGRAKDLEATVHGLGPSRAVGTRGELVERLQLVSEQLELLQASVQRALILLSRDTA